MSLMYGAKLWCQAHTRYDVNVLLHVQNYEEQIVVFVIQSKILVQFIVITDDWEYCDK